VIGILSQTIFKPKRDKYGIANYTSYIMAAYVRFLEGSGARVVPLLMNEAEEVTLKKMEMINGVLIPGGGGNYDRIGKLVLKKAMEINDNGGFFPIWGTCLGFEFLTANATSSHEMPVLEIIHAKKVSLPIKFTKRPSETKMFCPMGEAAADLEKDNYFINMHQYSVRPQTFAADAKLKEFWDVTSTSVSPDGQTFVATIEAKNYPFMATMFHPEKIAHQW